MAKLRLGVLVSGRGSNLQAILGAIAQGELAAEVAVVVSDHPAVPAIAHAARHGVPVTVIERSAYPSRRGHQLAIAAALADYDVQLVVLAGFDRVLGADVLQRFAGRIINVHPSLLPAFGGGLHAQADALAHGAKVSGCTVHFVTAEVDAGPIIIQRAVPVYDDDTPDTLSARILAEEHRALPEAIRLFASGRLTLHGRCVRLV